MTGSLKGKIAAVTGASSGIIRTCERNAINAVLNSPAAGCHSAPFLGRVLIATTTSEPSTSS